MFPKYGNNSDLSSDELEAIRLTALLHDTSHGPYSHQLEVLQESLTGRSHEDFLFSSLKEDFEEAIEEVGFSFNDIIKVFQGKTYEIIGDIIGADKIDYITRDLYHAGFSEPDVRTLMSYVIFTKKSGLCLDEKGLNLLAVFLHQWHVAHLEIYWRKASLIVQSMLRRCVWDAIERGYLELEELRKMRDYEVNVKILAAGGRSAELFRRILERELYKTSIVLKIEGYEKFERIANKPIKVIPVPEDVARRLPLENRDFEKILEIEESLSRDLGTDVILSTTPQLERMKPKDPKIYFSDTDEIKHLSEIDPGFLKYQQKFPKQAWTIRVTVPQAYRKKVYEKSNVVKDHFL